MNVLKKIKVVFHGLWTKISLCMFRIILSLNESTFPVKPNYFDEICAKLKITTAHLGESSPHFFLNVRSILNC